MYKFIIPNKKLITYQVFAYGILLINLAAIFVNRAAFGHLNVGLWTVFAGLIIGGIHWYRQKKNKKRMPMGVVLFMVGIFWLLNEFYPMFFLNLFLAALYTIACRQLIVTVSREQIIYPSFPPKPIRWEQINNIVLKDDILTIDLKNNKIYQHFIEYGEDAVNEADFNDFCKKQLMA